jgi:hypothetical protein
MSDEYEPLRVLHEAGTGRRMECPYCGRLLPIDGYTECDRCGAHIEVGVRLVAEGVDP